MNEIEVEKLLGKNADAIKEVLEKFNEKNAAVFNFEEFHTDDKWYKLWCAVFALLRDIDFKALHPLCLNSIRILTRDESSLSKHELGKDVCTLLELAQLTINDNIEEFDESSTMTVVDALKCLCNLSYQNFDCRRECVRKLALDALLKRVASPIQYPCTVELYDMKFLFLLTALDSEARTKAQIDLNGVAYMTEWLDEKLNEVPNKAYSTEELEVLSEILKVMFNITTSPDKSPNENEIQNMHLTIVIRDAFFHFGDFNDDQACNIISHAINLLTNISTSCLSELIIKVDASQATNSKLLLFEEHNVRALDIMLRFLKKALDDQENTAGTGELLPPVLTVLTKCARGHPVMRHYIRHIILPPLRDVSERPEVGNELRNHLCRYLTVPAMIVRDLSAELLFILCKENVRRMIKYTGYGNAAGLFARRGLLDCRRVETLQYSSDSEDSDTDEYKKKEQGINPVTGRFELPHKNPFEGMTEEQKEYEAEQLAILMDRLNRDGIVQPCRIDEDGKPVPVDHILQLQEELPQQADKKQKS